MAVCRFHEFFIWLYFGFMCSSKKDTSAKISTYTVNHKLKPAAMSGRQICRSKKKSIRYKQSWFKLSNYVLTKDCQNNIQSVCYIHVIRYIQFVLSCKNLYMALNPKCKWLIHVSIHHTMYRARPPRWQYSALLAM